MTEKITPAAVRVMLHRCGLSQTEAANYVEVQDRTVRRWLDGTLSPGPDKWRSLVDLCARQDRAADEAVEQIKASMKELGKRPDQIAIRVARTQEDADVLGCPCVGAHVAVVRRVMERAPKGIAIKPVYPGESEAADAAAARRTAH